MASGLSSRVLCFLDYHEMDEPAHFIVQRKQEEIFNFFIIAQKINHSFS